MHQTEVPIPSPCPADWNAMTGDARKRFCSTCDKHVHDLSAMTERQARVAAKPGSCVRYAHDRFGRIRHLPTFAIGPSSPDRRSRPGCLPTGRRRPMGS